MTVVDKNLLINHISQWIGNYTKLYNKNFTIIDKNNPFSPLLELLCEKAQLTNNKLRNIISDKKFTELIEIANDSDGIIIGNVTRNDILARTYKKYQTGDIFPLFNLYNSELISLLSINTDDLPEDYEWAIRLDEKINIISNDSMPNKNSHWFKLSLNQKTLIAALHQREKKTRHKRLENYPFCKIRDLDIKLVI